MSIDHELPKTHETTLRSATSGADQVRAASPLCPCSRGRRTGRSPSCPQPAATTPSRSPSADWSKLAERSDQSTNTVCCLQDARAQRVVYVDKKSNKNTFEVVSTVVSFSTLTSKLKRQHKFQCQKLLWLAGGADNK